MKVLAQKYWHKLFELGVLLKGVNGIWETTSGLLFLFLSKATLENWLFVVTRYELLEDPHDHLMNFLVGAFHNVSRDAQLFAAVYLVMHGLLNIFLVVQLYRNKHWAYLVTIGCTLFFLVYQIYRISVHHSVLLMVITLFDVIFVGLAWNEYKHYKKKRISDN